jgi:hypothetical protein
LVSFPGSILFKETNQSKAKAPIEPSVILGTHGRQNPN